MRKTPTTHPARSREDVALMLTEARNRERLRCAGVISARLDARHGLSPANIWTGATPPSCCARKPPTLITGAQELH